MTERFYTYRVRMEEDRLITVRASSKAEARERIKAGEWDEDDASDAEADSASIRVIKLVSDVKVEP